MRLVGVVAEYNPFSLGHAHHLEETRRRSGADGVVVVMSSTFVQRGEPAILSPHARAEMALRCGADAVIALPVMWSTREAEGFALGAVSLLHRLGVEMLSFGTERDALPLMQGMAELMEHPTPAFQQAIKQGLDRGWRYPHALAQAAEAALPGAGALLSTPNSTLGICYLRAMIRLGSPMAVHTVQRHSDYHGDSLLTPLPSATALRKAIRAGQWHSVKHAMPDETHAVLHRERALHRLMLPGGLHQAVMYRLRTMQDEDFAQLPGATEGMENWLKKQVSLSATYDALLQRLVTRRYPAARLRRMCIHALLGITARDMAADPLPTGAHLLGFRSPAVLHQIGKSGFPIYTNPKKIAPLPPWVQAEVRAYDIWSLGVGAPPGMMSTAPVLTPKDFSHLG